MQDRLEEINRELRELEEKNARRGRLDAALRDLRAQRAERAEQERRTAAVLYKEQADVEKLEGRGLKALLLSLSGDKEERLAKERREELSAQLRHDQAVRDLDYINREIGRVQAQQQELEGVRQRIAALLEEKKALLQTLGGETGRRLGELDRALGEVRARLREIDEAVSAGQAARDALNEVIGELDAAGDLGVWDMLGGGMLVTMAKHGHIDEARDGIDRAQRALSRFRTELSDVTVGNVPQVEIGQFATFADYFFDGLLSDWYVQSGIRDSQANVEYTLQRVEEALRQLDALRRADGARAEELERERDGLLRQA